MANEVLQKTGAAQFRFCVTGSLSSADAGTNWIGGDSGTDVVLTLASLADAGARQSDKVDLGATRARQYAVFGCVDYTGETAVTATSVDYYWAPSTQATQANGNTGGNSGEDAAAAAGGVGTSTVAEFLAICEWIGSLSISSIAGVQNGFVGVFSPSSRYGQLVVVNNGGDAFEDDDVEAHQVMIPLIDEIQ